MPGSVTTKDQSPARSFAGPESHDRNEPLCSGEMAQRIDAFDWSRTAIGPRESWSPTLHSTLPVMLANRFPQILWWGPQLVQFYNDAYVPIPGSKHPELALGRPAQECWAEIWDSIGPLITRSFQGGPSAWDDDILLEVQRHGFVEESHFIIAYSPVPDATAPGGIGGVLGTVYENTDKIIGERRLLLLRDLGAGAGEAKTPLDACRIAARTIAAHDRDVPFALLYLLDAESRTARLAASAGVTQGLDVSPLRIELASESQGWPLCKAFRSGRMQIVEDLSRRFNSVPQGPWRDPPQTAVVVPIPSSQPHEAAGLLVIGISARLKFDARYRDFLELLKTQIAASLANARAHEEEKRRAEALAELDRAKTVFFSNVSHEFRTPLSLMLGPIDDAANDAVEPLGPRQRQRLELVRRNGLRLQKLVNALLDFSRVEAGRVQAVFQPTDLASLTRDLASNFRSACEKAGLTLSINTPPLPEPVYVDREMWEKVVFNLISNAFKFTLSGTITVALCAEDAHAALRVSDTGIGIPQPELPFIFERFHRVAAARGRTHEGAGIGLALVQELTKLHAGAISVESAPGRGSTFTVRLPFGTAHLPSRQIKSEGAAGSSLVNAEAFVSEALRWLPGSNAGLTLDSLDAPRFAVPLGYDRRYSILVADDNADMRDYIASLLRDRFEVRTVSDGRTALAQARAGRPDAILSDVMMPGLDGFAMLRELRADRELRAIPVIFLSARAGEESRIEGLACGADDYLIKPFSGRELIARVESTVKMALLRQETEQALLENQRRLSAEAEAMARLNELSARLWRCRDLETGLNEMLGAVLDLLGADKGNVRLLNADGKLNLVAQQGFNSEVLEYSEEVTDQGNSACARALRSGERVIIEDVENDPLYEPLRAQGRAAGYRALISIPLLAGEDAPQGVLSMHFRDVHRPTERQLRRLDLYVRQASDFINRCRIEQALRETERALRESDQLKNEFLALLGHELRNPLAPIYTTSEILSRTLAGHPQAQAGIAVIKRQTRLLTRMVDDLLDVARITQGRISLERRPVDLSSAVAQSVETVDPLLSEKRHQLSIISGPRPLYVRGDAARLAQCISNLVNNAAKYTDPGGRIRVETRAEGSTAVIEVSDNGCGISEELLPRIFELFVQGDQSLDRARGGLGIGLLVVKRLVEMHGGNITAHSAGADTGATFTIRLPRIEPERSVDAQAEPLAAPPRRIFIVDDNQDAAESLAELLRLDGHEVAAVKSPAEALARIESFKPDAALIDIGLPEINGYQLLKRLRSMPALAGVRFIAVTGYGRAEDRNLIRRAGFDDHLVKPVSLPALTRALIGNEPRPRSSEAAHTPAVED